MVETSGLTVLVSGGERKKLEVNFETEIMLKDDSRFLAL